MKTTNLALKKLSSIIVIGVIFFSSPADPLVFVSGLFFGFGFIFFSYRNSVANDLKSKLEARSGISLFFVGFYSGFFLISFFSLLSSFFPELEKGFFILGDKFLINKKTHFSEEKISYKKSLIFYIGIQTVLVATTVFGFLFLFFSTVSSINSFAELCFLLSSKEAVLSFFQCAGFLFLRKTVTNKYSEFFFKYRVKALNPKELEEEQFITSYSQGYQFLSVMAPFLLVVSVFSFNLKNFLNERNISDINQGKTFFPKSTKKDGFFAFIRGAKDPISFSISNTNTSPISERLISPTFSGKGTSESPSSTETQSSFHEWFHEKYPFGRGRKQGIIYPGPVVLPRWPYGVGTHQSESDTTSQNSFEKIDTDFVLLPLQYDWSQIANQPVENPPKVITEKKISLPTEKKINLFNIIDRFHNELKKLKEKLQEAHFQKQANNLTSKEQELKNNDDGKSKSKNENDSTSPEKKDVLTGTGVALPGLIELTGGFTVSTTGNAGTAQLGRRSSRKVNQRRIGYQVTKAQNQRCSKICKTTERAYTAQSKIQIEEVLLGNAIKNTLYGTRVKEKTPEEAAKINEEALKKVKLEVNYNLQIFLAEKTLTSQQKKEAANLIKKINHEISEWLTKFFTTRTGRQRELQKNLIWSLIKKFLPKVIELERSGNHVHAYFMLSKLYGLLKMACLKVISQKKTILSVRNKLPNERIRIKDEIIRLEKEIKNLTDPAEIGLKEKQLLGQKEELDSLNAEDVLFQGFEIELNPTESQFWEDARPTEKHEISRQLHFDNWEDYKKSLLKNQSKEKKNFYEKILSKLIALGTKKENKDLLEEHFVFFISKTGKYIRTFLEIQLAHLFGAARTGEKEPENSIVQGTNSPLNLVFLETFSHFIFCLYEMGGYIVNVEFTTQAILKLISQSLDSLLPSRDNFSVDEENSFVKTKASLQSLKQLLLEYRSFHNDPENFDVNSTQELKQRLKALSSVSLSQKKELELYQELLKAFKLSFQDIMNDLSEVLKKLEKRIPEETFTELKELFLLHESYLIKLKQACGALSSLFGFFFTEIKSLWLLADFIGVFIGSEP